MTRILAALLVLSSSPLVLAGVADSDARAVAIARAVLERMGGEAGWNATRFVRWNFFGSRTHVWDKQTGDLRLELPERRDEQGEPQQAEHLILMNVDTRQGRVWVGGEELTDPDALDAALDQAHQVWINDSYWMFMPYKLLDPGVTLRYVGERALEDGRAADVLDMTFDAGEGYTPENRYEVFVARDSGLVEAWTFFRNATDEEPRFTMPWSGWKSFGRIWLATDHGRGADWNIAVDGALSRAAFAPPAP